MINAIVITSFAFVIISIFTEKKVFNPVLIIFSLWGLIAYLSSLGLNGLYQTDTDYPYFIILFGLVFFAIGYYLFKYILIKGKFNCLYSNKKMQYKLNYNVIYFLCIISICISLLKIYDMGLSFENGFSFKSLTEQISSASEEGHSPLINALFYLIASPVYLSNTVIFSYELVIGKIKKTMFFLSFILLLLRLLTTGGRIAIIQLGICVLTCFSFLILFKRGKEKRKKQVLFVVIPLIILFFIYESLSRQLDVIGNLSRSFAIQPNLLEYWIKEIGAERAYGLCSLNGIFYPFFYIVKNLLGIPFPSKLLDVYNMTQATFSEWIIIGQNSRCNAYVSSFWYFYYDWGLFGVAVGMLLWGGFSFFSFKRALVNKSKKNIMNYCIMVILLVYSFTDFELFKGSFVLGIIFLNFLCFSKPCKKANLIYA